MPPVRSQARHRDVAYLCLLVRALWCSLRPLRPSTSRTAQSARIHYTRGPRMIDVLVWIGGAVIVLAALVILRVINP